MFKKKLTLLFLLLILASTNSSYAMQKNDIHEKIEILKPCNCAKNSKEAVKNNCESCCIKFIPKTQTEIKKTKRKLNFYYHPLHEACIQKNEKMVDFLLKQKINPIDPNIECSISQGKTAFDYACEGKNSTIVALLLDNGALINTHVLENNHQDIVEFLKKNNLINNDTK